MAAVAGAGAAGMQPEEFSGRPMPHTLADFNNLLDQQVEFFDANGEKVKCCFYAAFKNLQPCAQGLQERVLARITHYEDAEVTASIHSELEKFEEHFNQVAVMVALAKVVHRQFQEMRASFDEASTFGDIAKPIMNKADIELVSRDIEHTANTTERDYLQKGTMYSYLPNHMQSFRELATAQKLDASDVTE